MDELFAPPGEDWQRVSPALARVRRFSLGIDLLTLAVVVGVCLLLVDLPTWLWLPAVVALVVGGVLGWVLIGTNARRWGYVERDADLFITHGALNRRLVVVPYGRMQYVDVHSGPLERLFGIASVHLHTASPATSAHLPGLPAHEAARLRDRLTSLGEAQAAGL